MRTYPVYLNGELKVTVEGYFVTNPANGEILAHMSTVGRPEVAQAIEAAHAAFVMWRRVPGKSRGEFLHKIATELERMGDYAVRIARMTGTLVALPDQPLRAEFGLMGELAIGQVHDILEALIDQNEPRAREVAARDNEIDRLYHRVFEDLVKEIGNGHVDSDGALRSVTLLLVAHNLERISDRVTNVAEDIIFLESGQVVELG